MMTTKSPLADFIPTNQKKSKIVATEIRCRSFVDTLRKPFQQSDRDGQGQRPQNGHKLTMFKAKFIKYMYAPSFQGLLKSDRISPQPNKGTGAADSAHDSIASGRLILGSTGITKNDTQLAGNYKITNHQNYPPSLDITAALRDKEINLCEGSPKYFDESMTFCSKTAVWTSPRLRGSVICMQKNV
uniref:Uncharacterized protein n=1 Tax=Romanomermis culicivorax TaxID=13658 RepID=A0A915HMV0_ROMCU